MNRYINLPTMETFTESELKRIYFTDYNGADEPTQALFEYWRFGCHYEIDSNGRPYKCFYEIIT